MKKTSNLIFDHKLMFAFFVGLVTILIVVAFNSLKEKQSLEVFEKDINKVEAVTSSDELTDIQSDLDNTDLENLDSELIKIEAELN